MNILKFYVLYFSVWEDLWPYSNAYVRPGTRATMSGDGKLEKMEVDYSTTVDQKIPECEQLVKVSLRKVYVLVLFN